MNLIKYLDQNTPFNINHHNNAEDHVPSNEASEVEGKVNAPVQGALQVTTSIIDPAPTRITKTSNSVRRNAASNDESISE
jgi:hypothetical protein